MTISTSSSTSRPLRATLLLATLLVQGCGQAAGPKTTDHEPPATPATSAPSTPRPAATAPSESLSALYTADLTRAVAGAQKVPFAAKGDVGGMNCSPATISGTDAASRVLTLTLPSERAARAHVLAVVTPERGLLELYSPYGEEAESEDIVVPSRTLSWAKARTQAVFKTSTDALDGLRPGRDTPEPLFIEAGRYRFALVNGIDAGLLKANGKRVEVEAACSFDWQP